MPRTDDFRFELLDRDKTVLPLISQNLPDECNLFSSTESHVENHSFTCRLSPFKVIAVAGL